MVIHSIADVRPAHYKTAGGGIELRDRPMSLFVDKPVVISAVANHSHSLREIERALVDCGQYCVPRSIDVPSFST
jgi:hypothetical protein